MVKRIWIIFAIVILISPVLNWPAIPQSNAEQDGKPAPITQISNIQHIALQSLDKPDPQPPVTNIQLAGAISRSYYTTAVTVTLSAVDDSSGVERIEYSLDGVTWQTYSVPFALEDDGVHMLRYRSIDRSGNQEKTKQVKIPIDRTAPREPAVLTEQTSIIFGDFEITIIPGDDDMSGYAATEYRIGAVGIWQEYTEPLYVSVSGSQDLYIRAQDIAGNITESVHTLKFETDITPPSAPYFDLYIDDWINESVYVAIFPGTDDESGVKQIEYRTSDSEGWHEYDGLIEITDEGLTTLYARTVDRADNISEIASVDIKIDKTQPTASVISLSETGWTSNPVTVSIESGIDNESMVLSSIYKFHEAEEWLYYYDPITIDDEGITPIYAATLDYAGNISDVTPATVFIDRTAPESPQISPDSDEWTNADVVVTITDGEDALSGVWQSQYRMNDSVEWLTYTNPIHLTDEGIYEIQARTLDQAKNASVPGNQTIRIDKTPPTRPSMEPDKTGWTNEDVTLHIVSGTDSLSGVAFTEYRIGEAREWTEYVQPVILTAEGEYTVYARTVDVAGNISEVDSVFIQIDKTPPQPATSFTYVTKDGSSALLSWNPGLETLSGIEFYEIFNGSDLLVSDSIEPPHLLTGLDTNAKYELSIRAIDRAGNVSLFSATLTFFTNDPRLSAGRMHSHAWNTEGSARVWGSNDGGQIGDDSYTNRPTASLHPYLDDFIYIDSGVYENIGIKADGTVWVWGDSLNRSTTIPEQVIGLESIVAVSIGINHYMALKEDGTVWTWGGNGYGQIGDGTTNSKSTPVQVPGLADMVGVSAGYYHSIALKRDGTVWAWGGNSYGQLGNGDEQNQHSPTQVHHLQNIIRIDTGGGHNLALRQDGTVWGWGWNFYGELGGNIFEHQHTPIQIHPLSGIIEISAAYSHNLVLKNDGTVWSWGSNNSGELGDGTTVQRNAPVKVLHMGGTMGISAGDNFSLAVKGDGSVWAWGNNTYNQLGDGTTADRLARVLVQGMPYTADNDPPTSPGELMASGITSSAIVLKWEESDDNHGVEEYLVYLNDELIEIVEIANDLSSATEYTVTGLVPESTYTLFVRSRDYTGLTSDASQVLTVTTLPSQPEKVEAGMVHSLMLKNDGTVWAWGSNSSFQLGIPNYSVTSPVQIPELHSIVDIAAGGSHSLALKSDGTVWAWGSNSSGQLGDPISYSHISPHQIEGLSSIVAISAGNTHSMALDLQGYIWVWGNNVYGQLGNGSQMDVYIPVKLTSLSNVTSISAGHFFSLATTANGRVYSWGNNHFGQLGNGSASSSNVPLQIPGLSNIVDVSAGGVHSIALQANGTVWTWGDNTYGAIGDGTTIQRSTPVMASLYTDASEISAGLYFSQVRTENNTIWSWGANFYGQVGVGHQSNVHSPTQIAGLTEATSLSAGDYHTLAINDGQVVAWGYNSDGQIGDGTKQNRNSPVVINNNPGTQSNVLESSTEKMRGILTENRFIKTEMQTLNPEIEQLNKFKDVVFVDGLAPTTPSNVVVNHNGSEWLVEWEESLDNVAVKQYTIYINHQEYVTTSETHINITTLPEDGISHIMVYAEDAAGNISLPSQAYLKRD